MNSTIASELIEEVKQSNNNRLDINSKVIKCSICNSIEALKAFKNSYICAECIEYLKDINQ